MNADGQRKRFKRRAKANGSTHNYYDSTPLRGWLPVFHVDTFSQELIVEVDAKKTHSAYPTSVGQVFVYLRINLHLAGKYRRGCPPA